MAEQPGATERGSSDPHLPVSSISGPEGPRSRNIWRDGLWIGAAAFLIITLGALYQTWLHLGPQGQQKRVELQGDGQNVPSYGFDLSQLADGINPNQIRATGKRKGEVAALNEPGHISIAENVELTGHEKYVLPTDRVIGVEVAGHARAYPIQVMQVHQLANDALGDRKIVVFYDPLSEVANAWTALAHGETARTHASESPYLRFANSGLSYKGISLVYDLDGEVKAGASLWNLLHGTAIAGPRAGGGLQVAPERAVTCKVLQWRDWLALHPDTTIVKRDEALVPEYKKDLYGPYYKTEKIPFAIEPQLSNEQLGKLGITSKSRGLGLALQTDGEKFALYVPHEVVLANATFDLNGLGRWNPQFEALEINLACRREDVGFTPSTVWVESYSEHGTEVLEIAPQTMLFPWYATFSETGIAMGRGNLTKP